MSRKWLFLLSCFHTSYGFALQAGVRGQSPLTSGAVFDSVDPKFAALPQLTPSQFLLISSPSQQKIVFTELRNFRSTSGRTFPLVDSGLGEPCGIAFDRKRGNLYVADRKYKKIFRYKVLLDEAGPSTMLVTDGVRLTIAENISSIEWVSVDPSGNVFYSNPSAKTINMIPAGTVDMLASGQFAPHELVLVSANTALATQSSSANGDMVAVDERAPERQILVMYQGNSTPSVGNPSGVATDGIRLYWGNAKDGKTVGTAMAGEVHPLQFDVSSNRNASAAFPSRVLSNSTESAQGLAKSNTMLFYSSNASGKGVVYGIQENGIPLPFAQGLINPKGLVWDGDQTVYVADEASDAVYSFPAGRVAANAPLARSVTLRGAFGVALLSAEDQAFALKAGTVKFSTAALPWCFLAMLYFARQQ